MARKEEKGLGIQPEKFPNKDNPRFAIPKKDKPKTTNPNERHAMRNRNQQRTAT